MSSQRKWFQSNNCSAELAFNKLDGLEIHNRRGFIVADSVTAPQTTGSPRGMSNSTWWSLSIHSDDRIFRRITIFDEAIQLFENRGARRPSRCSREGARTASNTRTGSSLNSLSTCFWRFVRFIRLKNCGDLTLSKPNTADVEWVLGKYWPNVREDYIDNDQRWRKLASWGSLFFRGEQLGNRCYRRTVRNFGLRSLDARSRNNLNGHTATRISKIFSIKNIIGDEIKINFYHSLRCFWRALSIQEASREAVNVYITYCRNHISEGFCPWLTWWSITWWLSRESHCRHRQNTLGRCDAYRGSERAVPVHGRRWRR